jgi:hypothetical protein
MKFVVTVLHHSSSTTSKAERVGEFVDFDEAVTAAKQIVNATLERIYVAGNAAPQLLAQYEQLAQAPYIFRDEREQLQSFCLREIAVRRNVQRD